MDKPDVIIIGSGCGASPAASNLASAGARVCVLERGTWWGSLQGKQPYPEGFLQFLKHIRGVGLSLPFIKKYIPLNRKAGLLEFYLVMNGYIIIIPCGVGGGSLVIGGFVDKPPRDIYDHYPDEITPEEMEPHFESVAKVIQPSLAPVGTPYQRTVDAACGKIDGVDSIPQMTSMWYGSGPNADEERINDYGCKQKNCAYQANCLTGCNRSSKNSTDITYLQQVLKNGGDIRELSEVTGIRKTDAGYTVDYTDLNDNIHREISAPKVIVSAGALNTVKILFASRKNSDGLPLLSRKLGHRWGFNGDRVGMKLAKHTDINHTYGPCLFRYHELKSDTYDFDFHQFACRISLLAWAPPPLRSYTKRIMPFLSLSREEPTGRISPAGDVVTIEYAAQDGHRRADRVQRLIAMESDALAKPLSEKERRKRIEKIESRKASKGIGSVHPTGGAAMANTIEEGVVDHRGEVFNYPGLFVCDASIFPIGSCCGPHFFILAHSDRISKLIIEREK